MLYLSNAPLKGYSMIQATYIIMAQVHLHFQNVITILCYELCMIISIIWFRRLPRCKKKMEMIIEVKNVFISLWNH